MRQVSVLFSPASSFQSIIPIPALYLEQTFASSNDPIEVPCESDDIHAHFDESDDITAQFEEFDDVHVSDVDLPIISTLEPDANK